MTKGNIAIIQPFVPTYRETFFNKLFEDLEYDLYSFQDIHTQHRKGLQQGDVRLSPLKLFKLGKLKWFNPLIVMSYKTIVLSGEFSITTNWLILLLGKFFKKNIYIWGHGVSYNKEKPVNFMHWLMYYLSNGGIFYTPKEMRFWKMKFPKKEITSLFNTLYIDQTYYFNLIQNKSLKEIKEKYGIQQNAVFISCHRFTNINRRYDLLLKVIKESDPEKVAFIIIGDGHLKPDFSSYEKVYDFNAIWDIECKSELFYLSDYYLQFGWAGLSIVEGMAFGKPIITLRRSRYIRQSVEYYYLVNNNNAIVLKDIEHFSKVVDMYKESYS